MVMQKLSKFCTSEVLILDSSGNNPVVALRVKARNSLKKVRKNA